MVDDGVLLRGVQVGRLEHQAIDIGHAIARLHSDGLWRLPAGVQQLGDIGLLKRRHEFAGGVAQGGDRWHVRHRASIHKVLEAGRPFDGVVAIVRRQQLLVLAVEADAIEMNEVRVAAFLLAHAQEIDHAVFLIQPADLRDVAFARGDLVFQFAGGQIVEIELPPIGLLAEPDEFVGVRQIVPVHAAVARFIERRGLLLKHIANRAG